MNRKLKFLLAGAALALPFAAHSAGLFLGFPQFGGPSYCSSYVNAVCTSTVPAGPTPFTGTEMVPADVSPLVNNGGSSPQTVLISLPQLGQGAMFDQTTVGTTQTIPANTPFYFLDGAQGSALTVTMPATVVDGQIQRIICEAATIGTLTVAANTSVVTQVVKGNPNTACVAGVGYAWRYNLANITWYRY